MYVGECSEYHGNYKWQKLPGGDHSTRVQFSDIARHCLELGGGEGSYINWL